MGYLWTQRVTHKISVSNTANAKRLSEVRGQHGLELFYKTGTGVFIIHQMVQQSGAYARVNPARPVQFLCGLFRPDPGTGYRKTMGHKLVCYNRWDIKYVFWVQYNQPSYITIFMLLVHMGGCYKLALSRKIFVLTSIADNIFIQYTIH